MNNISVSLSIDLCAHITWLPSYATRLETMFDVLHNSIVTLSPNQTNRGLVSNTYACIRDVLGISIYGNNGIRYMPIGSVIHSLQMHPCIP